MKYNQRVIHSLVATFMAAAPLTEAQAQVQGVMLEEVIVTAQKREQSLQDVPISVVAFGHDKLEQLGISTLTDIGANIPNLVVNSVGATPTSVRLFVRGIGQGDVQITQDPSVALYLDGVYIGTSVGAGFEGVDVARMEVLRGPQGTLYGRNATGGAVNIVTRRASTEALEFKQDLTAGNLGTFNANTVVNVPLSERTAAKFNYYHSERDSMVENDGPGNDFGMKDNDSLVLDFRFDISDDLSLDYRYEKADMTNSQRLEQVTEEGPGPLAGLTEISQVYSDRQDDITSARKILDNDLDIDAHSLFLDWAISEALTAKSITSWREMDNQYYSDTLATSVGNYGNGPVVPIYSVRKTEFEQFSQEFQLLGETERLNYVAGLYYYDDDSSQDGDGSSTLGNERPTDYSTADNTSLAIFGEATYTPAWHDYRWHFTLGARYSEDNRKATRDNQTAGFTGKYDEDFSNFNPALTIAYDINDDMNAYAKVVSGYKSGGTSQRSANAELFARGFDEEDIISYEIGFKGDFWGSRARLNAAVFHMDLDGLQASAQTGGTPGDRDFLPIDNNTVDGVELDVTMQLTDGLTAKIGYGYLDTELGEDSLSTVVGDFALVDTMWYAPENSFTASVDYYLPVSNGAFDFNMNYAYQDSVSTSINVADNVVLDDYALLGASINWSEITLGTLPGSFRVMLWGRNLLDEEYATFGIGSWQIFGASEVMTFGDQRTYGVTLSYTY